MLIYKIATLTCMYGLSYVDFLERMNQGKTISVWPFVELSAPLESILVDWTLLGLRVYRQTI